MVDGEAIDIAEARAVRQFKRTGCEVGLWEALSEAGYDAAEIQWHIEHPGELMRQCFVN